MLSLSRRTLRSLATCALLACLTPTARPYSLLTHEQLIDLTWQSSIVPLLLSRYPNLSPAQLQHARAYAYGGCTIQDIGYYPFGHELFSDLTHYIRTGDFVVNLFRNAGNPDELAFAIGALSHYIGDTVGHADATNLAVPIEFPKLRARYGPVVSYAEGEHQHVRTEFAFDINEIAHRRIAPVRFVRHVGLHVPTRQLDLAFFQTYGLSENFAGHRKDRINVRGYRFAVHTFLPSIAYAVTLLHREHEPADNLSSPEFIQLEHDLATIAAQDDWQHFRHRPGFGTYTLAGLLFVLPKLGPISLAAVKGPTAATEADYIHSVSLSTAELRYTLARFTPPPTTPPAAAQANKQIADANQTTDPDPHADAAPAPAPAPAPAKPNASQSTTRNSADLRHPLPNRDLDTGAPVQPGAYRLTDDTYARLLHDLATHPTRPIPPGVRDDIQAFYADPNAPILTKQNPEHWATVQRDLATLATIPTTPAPPLFPTYTPDPTQAP